MTWGRDRRPRKLKQPAGFADMAVRRNPPVTTNLRDGVVLGKGDHRSPTMVVKLSHRQ